MNTAAAGTVIIIAAFFLGGIPFGYLYSLARRGEDIRTLGSGNIGATNVLRNYGKGAFAIVLFMDVLKGVIPVVIAKVLGMPPYLTVMVGIAAIAGHNWSPYIGFKGGKGIATSAGVVLALLPWPVILICLAAFLAGILYSGIMSVGSVTAAAMLPIASTAYFQATLSEDWPYLVFALAASALAIYKHRQNIRRLMNGTEPKIGANSKG